MNPSLPIIGLAGGIGSGKSTAAKILAELGAEVIDADVSAREALASKEVVETIQRWWPEAVVGGCVDRRALARTVFQYPRLLGRLEGLLWPRVHARMQEHIRAFRAGGTAHAALVIDAPMLLEAGLEVLCDCVVFLEADEATRRDRVCTRGWSDDELARREAMQMPVAEKRERADHVFSSDDTLRQNLIALLSSLS
ncbi:MAG: dephospho-CoA kinase [Phycisphaerales bacterium]|nr:MAG: dephospho-CoA kinase [Phycisphaerales bacterium]